METLGSADGGTLILIICLILIAMFAYIILQSMKTTKKELNLKLHENRLSIFNEFSNSATTLIQSNNLSVILYGEPQDIFHAVEKLVNQGLALSLSFNSARLFFQKDAQIISHLSSLLEDYDKISKQLIELLSSYHLTHKHLMDKIKIYYPKIDFSEIEEKINQQYIAKKSQQEEELLKISEDIKAYQGKLQDNNFMKLFEKYLMPKRF